MKIIIVFNLLFLPLFFSESKSAAASAEDDNLVFVRLLRNFVGGSSSVPSTVSSGPCRADHRKRLAVLDTTEQLEFLSERLPGIAFDVLVLGAFHEKSLRVAEICEKLGSKITMLGRERHERHVEKRKLLGPDREKEALFGFSMTDVVDKDAYDVVLIAGEMNTLMPAPWYDSIFLGALKFGGEVYYVDTVAAEWDLSYRSWTPRFVGYINGHSVYGCAEYGLCHHKGRKAMRPDPARLMALARVEVPLSMKVDTLPPAFAGLKQIDVFRKEKLDFIEEAAAEKKAEE